MPHSRHWMLKGIGVASVIGLLLFRPDTPPLPAAHAAPVVDPAWLAPELRTPARRALREAAYWIAAANQAAADQAEACCAALEAWDPDAPCDRAQTRREQLAADPAGCLQRARQSLARAESLVQTAQERHRVAVTRAYLDAAAAR